MTGPTLTEEDVDDLLERLGFDPAESVLTRRQATVLALREQGVKQSAIAERLGTSRANVANHEGNARENVRKARETVSFAESLRAPIRVTFGAGTDIYDVPDAVYRAADAEDVGVEHAAPDLMKRVVDAAGDAIRDRELTTDVVVSVSREGVVTVRRGRPEEASARRRDSSR